MQATVTPWYSTGPYNKSCRSSFHTTLAWRSSQSKNMKAIEVQTWEHRAGTLAWENTSLVRPLGLHQPQSKLLRFLTCGYSSIIYIPIIPPPTHLSINAFIHPSIHPLTHSTIHPLNHLYIHPYIHPSIHTSIHTYIHTYIYTHTYTLIQLIHLSNYLPIQ